MFCYHPASSGLVFADDGVRDPRIMAEAHRICGDAVRATSRLAAVARRVAEAKPQRVPQPSSPSPPDPMRILRHLAVIFVQAGINVVRTALGKMGSACKCVGAGGYWDVASQ